MKTDRVLNATVIVSALGYFVDIYDLILFSVVRVASLRGIGVPEERLLADGLFLLNAQMFGMLTGGILWGVLGDKRGRVSVLFGSILLYSLTNIANAFVTNVPAYAICRFLAGLGLAGELGAAITLVSEVLSREKRGYGTTIVASVGVCGAVVASLVGELSSWQTAYIVGGVMGMALLIMRWRLFESGMFATMKERLVRRGDFSMLFYPARRLRRYLAAVVVGVPIWFIVGILISFSPEFSRELGVSGTITAAYAVMNAYIGLALGDFASGFLSQLMRSRRRVLGLFLTLSTLLILIYLLGRHFTPFWFYTLCLLLGFAAGYWAVFVTSASEQFGTNLRATVTTTAPNFVRGSVVPITLTFKSLAVKLGVIHAALVVGLTTVALAAVALLMLPETYGKDLDYLE